MAIANLFSPLRHCVLEQKRSRRPGHDRQLARRLMQVAGRLGDPWWS